jgi:hypothetical protein
MYCDRGPRSIRGVIVLADICSDKDRVDTPDIWIFPARRRISWPHGESAVQRKKAAMRLQTH